VKACDRGHLTDALALIERLRTESAAADTARETAEAEARRRGHEAGYAAGRTAFAEAIAALAAQASADRVQAETEVAALALTALRQIAGDLGDAAVMQGVALRAARAVVPQGPVAIEVAPIIAAEVEAGLARLDPGAEVTVRADPTLGERQCRVTGPDSRIIADLDRQIAGVAERWGVADES
jgi:flagellar biosynthesis/type III secretory pathway protein FliH